MDICLKNAIREIKKHTIHEVHYAKGENNEKNTLVIAEMVVTGSDSYIAGVLIDKIEKWKATKGGRYEKLTNGLG